jgi:hypothetical protein
VRTEDVELFRHFEASPTVEPQVLFAIGLQVGWKPGGIDAGLKRGEGSSAEAAALEGRLDAEDSEIPMGLRRVPGFQRFECRPPASRNP